MTQYSDASRLETLEIWDTIVRQLEADTVTQVAQQHGVSPAAIRAAQRRTGRGRLRTRVVRPDRMRPEREPDARPRAPRRRRAAPVVETVTPKPPPAPAVQAPAIQPPAPAEPVRVADVEVPVARKPVAQPAPAAPSAPAASVSQARRSFLVWATGEAGPFQLDASGLADAALQADRMAPGRVLRVVDARVAPR